LDTVSSVSHDLPAVAYYERKTQDILRRYGPGPRVHYHTGLVNEPPAPGASIEELRRELVASQEQALRHASRLWDASSHLCGDVLDVGCGLGGGTIFWAQEFGAQVTGVTVAPSHVDLIRTFARQAGVERQVRVALCDALATPGEACFDAAVAIDSVVAMPRGPLFRRLARLLRPDGRIFIFDCLLGRPGYSEYAEPFNSHWCSQIGTLEEYVAAAQGAGFTLTKVEDVSRQAVHFWTRTLAIMSMEAEGGTASAPEAARLEQSLRLHALLRRGLLDDGLRHTFLSFARC
jgi:cyclopropane fatty-acyl-phospholipid synthase-like methyltransferase